MYYKEKLYYIYFYLKLHYKATNLRRDVFDIGTFT